MMHASPVEYSTPLPPRNPVLCEISVEEDAPPHLLLCEISYRKMLPLSHLVLREIAVEEDIFPPPRMQVDLQGQ